MAQYTAFVTTINLLINNPPRVVSSAGNATLWEGVFESYFNSSDSTTLVAVQL